MPSTSSRGWIAFVVCIVMAAFADPAAAQLQPTYGPPSRVDTGGGTAAANETTAAGVAGTHGNPGFVVAGWNDWRESGSIELIRTGFAMSIDGGTSWFDFLVRPPFEHRSFVEGDPMTAVDPRTGTVFVGGMSFGAEGGIYVSRRLGGQGAFEPSVMAIVDSSIDKGWMAAGAGPGGPDTTRVYIGFNQGLIWSDDLGSTWTEPRSLCTGIGYLPRIAPDGTIHIAYWDFEHHIRVLTSSDGGNTFTDRIAATRLDVWVTQDGSRVPGRFRVPPLASLAVSPIDGTLAVAYFDTSMVKDGQHDLDIWITRSRDGGKNWETPEVVVDDDAESPLADQFYPWLEYDAEGRLHMVYLDTRHDPREDDATNGMFDAYHAWSHDDGRTWRETRLTEKSFDSNDDGLDRPQQFLGDYLGMAMLGDTVVPVYPDTSAGDTDIMSNRVELPVVGDVDGDRAVTVSDLLGVLGAWGPCPPPGPCAPDVDGSGSIDFDDLFIVVQRLDSEG